MRAVVGLFPANAVGDDVELYTDETRTQVLTTLHFLRQQKGKPQGQPHECLADYIAPKASGVRDYIGAFAVTAGIGIEEHVARFEKAHDDYSSIMLKALADRLAEACAEHFHERVRRELWGYAAQRGADQRAADPRGVSRHPAGAGLSGLPGSHREGASCGSCSTSERNAGITLTESFAMYPTAAVSGWYFAHPESRYFAVGKIDRDQVQDYARRKGDDARGDGALAGAESGLRPARRPLQR